MENEIQIQTNQPEAVVTPQVEAITPTSAFGNKETFEHSQRVALMLSKSELVPDTYQQKPANVMIALEIANRISASPLMVMQNLYIVHGRPAWSSQFLIATLNACGRFSSLRYEEDERDGGRTRAVATDKRTGEICLGAWVSMQMATAEGWVSKKGSKWLTMPELMRRYRAAAFFTRQFAPEVSMGFQTYEEAVDIRTVTPEAKTNKAEEERLRQLIEKAPSLDHLKKLERHLQTYPDLADTYAEALAWFNENGEGVL